MHAGGGRTAIACGDRNISYDELLRDAGRIAHFLLERKLGEHTVVGICLEDRPEIIAAFLGVMFARCVFVPIDPRFPQKRFETLVRDLDPGCLICPGKEAGPASAVQNVTRFFYGDMLQGTGSASGYPQWDGDDPLYIYFTSGSTGSPKGIVGRNASVRQFLQWETAAFGITGDCRVSQLISPYFDAFLRDIFVPLLTGGTICIPDETRLREPAAFAEWIDRAGITHIHCVPSVFRIFNSAQLTPASFAQLKYVFMSGERIGPSELTGWFHVFGSRIQLVNFYGATETTMIRSFYLIRPEDVQASKLSIGSPIPDTRLVVTDRDGRPCRPLVPGDLYIESPYVSKGYLNRPELTHEKFHLRDGTIAFRTGDKARTLPDGRIELLGREDRQIKLRGIRIELDEIETQLMAFAGVGSAAVVKHPEANGDESLIAYISGPAGEGSKPLSAAAAEHLRERLPDYMIPASIIQLDTLPLLSNGKIDYNDLAGREIGQEIVGPTTETETRLLAIWKEILGDKPLSIEAGFHASGGNSISIMRLIAKIYKEFKVRIALNQLFNNLTIRKQALLIGKLRTDELFHIPAPPRKPGYRLSIVQQRLYTTYEHDRRSTAFNMPMVWEMTGTVDRARLEKSIASLLDRHESLRTAFRFEGGEWVQQVNDTVDLRTEDITATYEGIEEAIAGFVRPFDLGVAPLIRTAVIHLRSGKKFLIVDVHHIVCDGFSQEILLTDFLRFYRGERPEALPLQYKDYAEWEHEFRMTDEYASYREFWLQMFEGQIPFLRLPTLDAGRSPVTDAGDSIVFSIDRQSVAPFLALLREKEITAFSGWFALLGLFLYQVSGQDDLVIGINTSGRVQEEMEGVVGMFAKTLPIRVQIDDTAAFSRFVKEVHDHLVRAYSMQLYDLADILRELNSKRDIPVTGLIDVMFVFLDFEQETTRTADEGFVHYPVVSQTSKYALTLFCKEMPDRMEFRMEYSTGKFGAGDIAMLIEEFKALVQRAVRDIDKKMLHLLEMVNTLQPFDTEKVLFKF